MSENTKIEWADNSWSPWRGCTKVSAGCAHCYAETLSKRNPAVLGQWGKGKPRVLAKNWNDPVKWEKHRAWFSHECKQCGSQFPSTEWKCCGIGCGIGFRSSPRPRVFPSLCDWLDEEVPIEWLARFLKLIHDTPNLDWLLLTKRPENWYRRIYNALLQVEGITDPNLTEDDPQTPVGAMLNDWLRMDDSNAPRNVWVGTSVEDQPNEKRIFELLSIPAKLRFLSVEPMLGPVDLSRAGLWLCRHWKSEHCLRRAPWCPDDPSKFWWEPQALRGTSQKMLDWVIVGGESGPGARPCNAEWIRELIRQCAAAKVPCFVKQLGAVAYGAKYGAYNDYEWAGLIKHPKGGDPDEWPEDLRVRQFPEVKP